MGKDLIIGGASNYGWNELKYWINSIQRSGFAGSAGRYLQYDAHGQRSEATSIRSA